MTKELESTATFWGLKALIADSTILGNNLENIKGSCIDNISSNSEVIPEARVLDWNFSDHLAVMVKRKRVRTNSEKVEFKGRSYRNYSREELQGSLINDNWEQFYNSRDPILCSDILEDRIRAYLDNNCPQKKFKVEIEEANTADFINNFFQ